MRHTKLALLIFGLGLVLGFVAVVGEIARLEPVASAAMALGLVLLPVALIADGYGAAAVARLRRRFAGRSPAKTSTRSSRKPPAKRAPRSSEAGRAARHRHR